MKKAQTKKKGIVSSKQLPDLSMNSSIYGGFYGNSVEMAHEEFELPKNKNEKWSQVITIGKTAASQINLVCLQDALEEHNADPLPAIKSKKKPWEMVFDPEQLLKDHEELLI